MEGGSHVVWGQARSGESEVSQPWCRGMGALLQSGARAWLSERRGEHLGYYSCSGAEGCCSTGARQVGGEAHQAKSGCCSRGVAVAVAVIQWGRTWLRVRRIRRGEQFPSSITLKAEVAGGGSPPSPVRVRKDSEASAPLGRGICAGSIRLLPPEDRNGTD